MTYSSVHVLPAPKQKYHNGKAWQKKALYLMATRKQRAKDRVRDGDTFQYLGLLCDPHPPTRFHLVKSPISYCLSYFAHHCIKISDIWNLKELFILATVSIDGDGLQRTTWQKGLAEQKLLMYWDHKAESKEKARGGRSTLPGHDLPH